MHAVLKESKYFGAAAALPFAIAALYANGGHGCSIVRSAIDGWSFRGNSGFTRDGGPPRGLSPLGGLSPLVLSTRISPTGSGTFLFGFESSTFRTQTNHCSGLQQGTLVRL